MEDHVLRDLAAKPEPMFVHLVFVPGFVHLYLGLLSRELRILRFEGTLNFTIVCICGFCSDTQFLLKVLTKKFLLKGMIKILKHCHEPGKVDGPWWNQVKEWGKI